MLTVVIKRTEEPKVIQLTQENIMRELGAINGSEMLLEDTWAQGLRKVRTPFVCLVEADCTLSANYISSNFGLMHKTVLTKKGRGGGYTKLAMLASCLGVNSFANRIYNYSLQDYEEEWDNEDTIDFSVTYQQALPYRKKDSTTPYPVQIGFVPGAVIRMASIKDVIDTLPWDDDDLVELSTVVSFHLWNTGRRVNVNPNTTYVSTNNWLEEPKRFDPKVSDTVMNIFMHEGLNV